MPSMSSISPAKIVGVVALVLAVSVVATTAFTGYDTVRPGQVAVIKNNVTGTETVQQTEGIILHLPWGITDVYVLDKTQRPLTMAGQDSVVIKTREGANVDTNVEVTFNLKPADAGRIVQQIGMGRSGADMSKVDDLVYSYVRAKIRDAIGGLNLEELARPEARTARIEETKRDLNEELVHYGIEIQTVSATAWDYDDKYEDMIKRRKEADQIFVNQAAAQETNRKKQETTIAEQNRIKSNAIAEASGDVSKEIIAKEAWSVEQRAKAEGDSYKTKKEADGAFLRLQNEAAALTTELTRRAQGIQALAEAYATGGIGMVKEVLAGKLKGVRIVGRPFSNDAQPQRVQYEEIRPPEAAGGGR
ncbi:MAG: hypothetical protein L0216_05410 [Planctomycetales bacterium]|nr:hypothetical protein [Planctomycetales bacterium]